MDFHEDDGADAGERPDQAETREVRPRGDHTAEHAFFRDQSAVPHGASDRQELRQGELENQQERAADGCHRNHASRHVKLSGDGPKRRAKRSRVIVQGEKRLDHRAAYQVGYGQIQDEVSHWPPSQAAQRISSHCDHQQHVRQDGHGAQDGQNDGRRELRSHVQ